MPALWDGRPVEWDRWERHDTWICGKGGCHNAADDLCDNCQQGDLFHCRGVVYAQPGELLEIGQGRLTRHVGLILYATRCRHCGHTTVLDSLDPGACEWTLDDSDYGADGSWPNQQELPLP